MSFRLVRECPDGQIRTQDGLKSVRQAATALAYVLTDNLRLRRQDASPIAFQAEHSPLGTAIKAYGYTFRIESES